MVGCDFTQATNSATVVAGMFLFTTSTNGLVPTTLIGAKSFCGSKFTLFMAGAMVSAGCTPQSSVEPSGAARATASAAIAPLAPSRFSTTNCWPNVSAKRCAVMRAMLSELPPAA